jgi:hypothetical protein
MANMHAWVKCEVFREYTRTQLRLHKPSYVVLSWSNHGPPHAPSSDQAWDAAAAEYFGLLNDIGAKVIILLDAATRHHGQSLPDVVAGAPNAINRVCVQDKSALMNLADGQLWRRWLARSQSTYHYMTLETMDLICGSTLCPCVVANRLVYWDSNHLTWQVLDYLYRPVLAQLLSVGYFDAFLNSSETVVPAAPTCALTSCA